LENTRSYCSKDDNPNVFGMIIDEDIGYDGARSRGGGMVYRALMRFPKRVHWTNPGDRLKVGEASADVGVPRDQVHARRRFIADKR